METTLKVIEQLKDATENNAAARDNLRECETMFTNTVLSITADELIKTSSFLYHFYTPETFRKLCAGRECLTGKDVLDLDIPEYYKHDIIIRSGLIPEQLQHELACRVAEQAFEYVSKVDPNYEPDPASLAALETKRAWLRGEATDEQLTAARSAAYVAALILHDIATEASYLVDSAANAAEYMVANVTYTASYKAACAADVASRAAHKNIDIIAVTAYMLAFVADTTEEMSIRKDQLAIIRKICRW